MKPTSLYRRIAVRRAGFTLIEVMVALGLMLMLLAIIFVPLNQAFNFFRIGQARTALQQAARLTASNIEEDLRHAIHIYPNAVTPGITDAEPYRNSNNNNAPYIRNAGCSDTGNGQRVGNTSRIDILLPELAANGEPVNPVTPGYVIVTYYARRLDNSKPYDAVDNPIVMFRAQMPYREIVDTPFYASGNSGPLNVDTTNDRYKSGECTDRGSRWLMQSAEDEPNLELMSSRDTPNSVEASHTLVTPRGMGLPAPRATASGSNRSYQPNSSFLCEDANSDGKIDRVTINMALEQYESSNSGTAPKSGSGGHRIVVPLVVDLPNVPKGK